jgi:hypothetical protein
MVSAYHARDVGASIFGSNTRREWCRDGAKKGAAQAGRSEHSGAFQGAPQSAIRLSCAEIRHLCWQLGLAVERSAAALLRWSNWRRRHQGWARRHHYRKRAGGEVERQAAVAECVQEDPQVPDIQELWRRLEPLLSTGKRSGRPYSQERLLVLKAIVHVMQTDCGWQALPSHFPHGKTVYAHRQWRKAGIWDKIWVKSAQRCSHNELQL